MSVEKEDIDMGNKAEENSTEGSGLRHDEKQARKFCDGIKTTTSP